MFYTNNINNKSNTKKEDDDIESGTQVVSTDNGYSKRIEDVLERIRRNCIKMSNYHNARYHNYKWRFIYYFRIPILIFSSLNSFVSLGLQPFLNQQNISIITAVISLICGLITSIELLLNIQKKLEIELNTQKEFYRLSIIIYKELRLNKKDRGTEGKSFLTTKLNEYEKLISNSNVRKLNDTFTDDLMPWELEYLGDNQRGFIEPANYNITDTIIKYIPNPLDIFKSNTSEYMESPSSNSFKLRRSLSKNSLSIEKKDEQKENNINNDSEEDNKDDTSSEGSIDNDIIPESDDDNNIVIKRQKRKKVKFQKRENQELDDLSSNNSNNSNNNEKNEFLIVIFFCV